MAGIARTVIIFVVGLEISAAVHPQPQGNLALLGLSALGIVLGDIGTSPLATTITGALR